MSQGLPRFDMGAALRELRGAKSQEQFGAELGVSRQTVLRWENNEGSPSAETLLRMNVLYGVDPLHVLTGRRPNTVTLDAPEKALLDRYRAAGPALRKAIDAVSALRVVDK